MLISAQQLNYHIPGGELLFSNVNFSLRKGEKAAIVGHNGAGKTTLLKIVAGIEKHYSGSLHIAGRLYYVPQHYGHFDGYTVAEALGIAPLLEALEAVENGSVDQLHYDMLEHHWDIRSRCSEAFVKWGIPSVLLHEPMHRLSGGMKTRLFLSGIDILQPDAVLMDEPTNHLDAPARTLLYEWMEQTSCSLLLTSHDRQLLRGCAPIWELHAGGIKAYGGNYDFYAAQKNTETAALQHQLAHQEKTLKEARQKQQQALERKQHTDAQARKKYRHSSEPKGLLNAMRNNAEASTGKLKEVHQGKVNELRAGLQETAAMVQMERMMKGYFDAPAMPAGKVLLQANHLNHAWENGRPLWPVPLIFTVRSGNRLAITGNNGSGKSTLLKLLQGKIQPAQGTIQASPCTALLLDQDYSLIDRQKTVLEQAEAFNETRVEPAALHTLLANFLFLPDSWHKPCSVLSGGEMLRLSLCGMLLMHRAPDIIYLDEPVNNLDLANIRMMAKIFAGYRGTLIVISHDTGFLEEVGITGTLTLRAASEELP